MREIRELDKIIYGRINPHIYAFMTNTIPNYLKVGDTYRPVNVRIAEWREHYPDLVKKYEVPATIDDETFFRDYAIHKYLEEDLCKHRLAPSDIDEKYYYSKEFFEDTDVSDIEEAIEDIKKDFENKTGKYNFYDPDTQLSIRTIYERNEVWEPRPNQQKVIDNFWKAYHDEHRKNLLMYAVMRFGKSFTAMCCAKKMDANIVVVVSAKVDVRSEWKKTVEKPLLFDGYEFLTSDDLLFGNTVIKDKLEEGKKVVIFLTLQDLQGNKVKEKHKELLSLEIDMLLVDETHFGARAEKYGAILRDSIKEIDDEIVDTDEANSLIQKHLNSKVCIHLSGTPYRVLMTSEFEKEDIIAFVQFSDIVDAQTEWDSENNLRPEPLEEWENPYYGFPQMIRFAFNPSKKTRDRIIKMHEMGLSTTFSDIFRPKSINVDSEGNYKKFIYEDEVLDLLEIIDGSKTDENILSLLDYDKIKEGKLCQHIVVALPYCSSCDAFEELIKNNKNKFKNLSSYEIINISGGGSSNKYKTTEEIKNTIREYNNEKKKTITLTVNRMLTGSTVEEWDTMIYLKDTSSPQEYDQSIFRLQNQFIKKYVSDDGEVIKFNNKPQTLLVDFNPNRMFIMQEEKSKIYNVNVDKAGNNKLKERLEKELAISPIIVMNKNKICQIEAVDIMSSVSNYSNSRGVVDETNEIPVDFKLLDIGDIKSVIDNQAELGSKRGLSLFNTDEVSDDYFDLDDDLNQNNETNTNENQNQSDDRSDTENNTDDTPNFEKKFRTYYARILFYSFLTKDDVNSLEDIIKTISNDDNRRIARNLAINPRILKLINDNMNPFITSKLDYKIHNINKLSYDENSSPIERASSAMRKFDKLSDNEIVTPQTVCCDVLNSIPFKEYVKVLDEGNCILDIASKQGEFALAIANLLDNNKIDIDTFKDKIYSIPTSGVAYEFTRKIYEILGFNIDNISSCFYSYDLIQFKQEYNKEYSYIANILIRNEKFSKLQLEENLFTKEGEKMKFDIVVGNPPYQLEGGSGGNNDAPIYQEFFEVSRKLNPKYISMIIKAGWFSAGRENLLSDFRTEMLSSNKVEKLVVYPDSSEVFENVTIAGGLCYFVYNNSYNGECNYKLIQNNKVKECTRNLNDFDILIREYELSSIVKKVQEKNQNQKWADEIISNDTPFGISSNLKMNKNETIKITKQKEKESDIRICYIQNRKRTSGYIDRNIITKHKEDIDKYNVFLPGGFGGGDAYYHKIIGTPEYGGLSSVCSQSYLYASFDTEIEAINFMKYIATKFLRVLVSAIKITQSAPSKVYRFVPVLDFSENSNIDWSKSIDEIDNQLYIIYSLSKEEIEYINNKVKDFNAE